VPGPVVGLSLKPGSNNITVNWKKPIINGYCVTNYVIYWVNTLSGSSDTSSVSSKGDSFIIEHLGACEGYEVSVTAVSEKHEDTNLAGKMATQTTCNSHTHNAYYIYILVAIMMLVNI
jgi:hypothetical protein